MIKTSRSFAISLRIEGWPVLVVGGGPVALHEAKALQEAGAKVTMVAPAFASDLEGVTQARREPTFDDLEGMRLALFASDSRPQDRKFYAEARRRGVPASVIDDPGHGDFDLPATFRRGAIEVAISTGGACPAFAAWARDRLAAVVDESWARALEWFARIRDDCLVRLSTADRQHVHRALLAENPVAYFEQGQEETWEEVAGQILVCYRDRLKNSSPEPFAHTLTGTCDLRCCPEPCPDVRYSLPD